MCFWTGRRALHPSGRASCPAKKSELWYDRKMTFHLHTYGCQMNVRDSEAVEALLSAAGHVHVEREADAELVIINSCTVRDMAERKAVGKCGNLIAAKEGRGRQSKSGGRVKIVGLMGCAVKRMGADVFQALPGLDFAAGPRRFGMIPRLVARCLAGETHILELPDDDEVPTGMDAHGGGVSFQSYVTILLGCDNRCSYCIVPDVRGHEYSRPAREVVAEVRALAARGVKEVCLLGQSVLRYGVRNKAWSPADPPSPGGYTEAFPRLLEALSAIDGLERIRFTSAHPKGCTDELVRAYAEFPKVCRHLHLPVQSGSDRVLKEMGRHYTRAEYLSAVAKLRAFDPEFAVTTDVIVGYPGETEVDFEATRSLMEEAGFDNQALLADQQRRGLARNGRLVGTVREVLVEGPSLRNAARWSGRDGGNRIVVFEPRGGALAAGALAMVRIREAHPQILMGEIV